MSNVVPFSPACAGEIMEQVLLRGDLSQLTHAERVRYLIRVCESLGLNPLTKPFEYIMLNGKLTLYALKGCTDQLRNIHGVSVSVVGQKEEDGLFHVHVRATTPDGRHDEDFGLVTMSYPERAKDNHGNWTKHPKAGELLKGDDRANAIMKAITKAKRRVTLSLCGLGMLDETELETIPESAKRPPAAKPRTVMPAPKTRLLTTDRRYEEVIRQERTTRRDWPDDMNDELPGDLGPPKDPQRDADAASFLDLVEGGR